MSYPDFSDFLRERAGSNWVLARRTPRIVAKYGESVRCLSDREYSDLKRQWAAAHPATLLVDTLPTDETGLLVRAVVADALGRGL